MDTKKPKYIFICYQLFLLVFLGIFGFLIYSNTIHGPFIFDDILWIRDNINIHIKEITWRSINQILENNDRPISLLSFSLNYYFGRLNPIGYHLVNILIHIISGILLYILMKDTLNISISLKKNANITSFTTDKCSNNIFWLSFFAALLWLIHPLNTQSVSYILQRMNSMGAMFYLLSLICFIKGRNNQISNQTELNKKATGKVVIPYFWFFGSLISGICAFGCKQNTAALPIFIFLYEWFFFQDLKNIISLRPLSWIFFGFIIISVLYVAFGWNQLSYGILSSYGQWGFTLKERLLTEFRVVVYYLSLIIFPYPSRLNLDYDYPLSYSLINPPITLISIFTIIILFATAVHISKKERLISFGILWFLGNLVIESSVFGIEIIYEHRLYLPSMFIILIFVLMIYRYLKIQWMAHSFMCLIIIIFSFLTYQRNLAWNDDIALWTDCVKKSPNKARPSYNLGASMSHLGKREEAMYFYKNALRINPDYAEAHNNLGDALDKQGRTDEAIAHYLQALKIKPDYAEVYYNLGNALDKKGRTDEAITHYLQALRIKPDYAAAHNNLGNALDKKGRVDEAITHYLQALQIMPDCEEVYYNLGNALDKLGRIDEAIQRYMQAIRIKPDFAEAHANLGIDLDKLGRTDEAIQHYRQVIKINPDFAVAQVKLGITLDKQGRTDEAIQHYMLAIKINPDFAEAHANLGITLDKQGRIDEAIQHYMIAIRIKPDFAVAFNGLGVLYVRKGDINGAIAYFQEALRLKPDYINAKNNLNNALTIQQKQ